MQKLKAFSEMNAEESKIEEDPRHVLDNYQSQHAEEREIPDSQAQNEKLNNIKTEENDPPSSLHEVFYPPSSLQEENDALPQDFDSILWTCNECNFKNYMKPGNPASAICTDCGVKNLGMEMMAKLTKA